MPYGTLPEKVILLFFGVSDADRRNDRGLTAVSQRDCQGGLV